MSAEKVLSQQEKHSLLEAKLEAEEFFIRELLGDQFSDSAMEQFILDHGERLHDIVIKPEITDMVDVIAATEKGSAARVELVQKAGRAILAEWQSSSLQAAA